MLPAEQKLVATPPCHGDTTNHTNERPDGSVPERRQRKTPPFQAGFVVSGVRSSNSVYSGQSDRLVGGDDGRDLIRVHGLDLGGGDGLQLVGFQLADVGGR